MLSLGLRTTNVASIAVTADIVTRQCSVGQFITPLVTLTHQRAMGSCCLLTVNRLVMSLRHE